MREIFGGALIIVGILLIFSASGGELPLWQIAAESAGGLLLIFAGLRAVGVKLK